MKSLKRFLAALLALVLCIGQVPALITPVYATDETCPGAGNHTKANCDYTVVKVTLPDCGNAGYTTYQCNVCQETFVDDIVDATGEHQWVDLPGMAPTCTKPGYEAGKGCSLCGMVVPGAEIPALSETATECEWVDMTPVIDCVTGGVKIFQCTFCGATREISVAPGQHNWDVRKLAVIQPATATENGLAEVRCSICGAVKEIVVYFTHTHDNKNPAGYIVTYPEIAATCTTDGMQSYMQCRVCDAVYFKRMSGSKGILGWYQLTEEEWTSLVIPAAHTFEQAPTCVDNVRVCLICKEKVEANVAHLFTTWSVEAMPTCSKAGYRVSTCANCGIAVNTEVLPPLGHYAVTVNVPATCASNAYSFTYCTRIGCEDGSVNPEEMYPMTADVFAPVNDVSVGEPFYLGMSMATLGTELYFTGAMDGNYLAASYNIHEAVAVYLEIVHPMADNTYRMFFYDAEDVKTYIEIYEYDPVKHRVGVHLTTEPVNTFNWNAELGILTSNINNTTYYLGSYKTYDNFSASAIRYITGSNASKVGVTQFPAYLSAVGVNEDVCVISYTVEWDGGFDANTHVMVSEIVAQSTCTEPGCVFYYCTNPGCAATITAEIAPSHCWAAIFGELTIEDENVPASGMAGCEDGWQYYQCVMCQEIQKKIIPGYGHIFSEVVEQNPDHLNMVAFDYQSCIYCDFTVKLTEKVWADANKHWDTFEQANEAHGGFLTGNSKTFKVGDCIDYGLEMYTCEACNKKVYVKIAGTGQHIIPDGTAMQAPTCTDMGYLATYKCERCEAFVGDAPVGELNMIPALGHVLVENSSYKPAACDKPNYANYSHICAVCGVFWSDGTMLLAKIEYDDVNPCTSVAFEYYLCHCGEEHIISLIPKLGHNMVELPRYDANGQPTDSFKAPTCFEYGYTTLGCSYCGTMMQVVIDKDPHINADGEEFTDKCTDTVADRHCVVCHNYYGHDALGSKHDCTQDANKDGIPDCLGQCLISSFHHLSVSQLYPSTCGTGAYHRMQCADCGYENVNFFDGFTFSGHKPASNLETYYEDENGNVLAHENGPQPTYLAAYTYVEDYVWYSVEIDVNGELFQNTEVYTAKFIEYVPATDTSDGYMTMYCQECHTIVTQTLPKTGTEEGSQGLEFTLSKDGTYYIVSGIGTCEDSHVVIPATYNGLPVTTIGNWAFSWCEQLTGVTLPDSITTIEWDAFNWCYNMTNINIPDSVTAIYSGAFQGCQSLTSVFIPASVTFAGNGWFGYCTSLTEITVDQANPALCAVDGVLYKKDMSELLGYPAGKTDTSFVVPSTVTKIDSAAFEGCRNLSDITLPEGLLCIYDRAFKDCQNLQSIELPSTLTYIGDHAFDNCSSLTEVIIPASVTFLDRGAFAHCYGLHEILVEAGNSNYCTVDGVVYTADLKTLVYYPAGKQGASFAIPAGTEAIEGDAFFGVKNLKEITIPSSMTTISASAFEGFTGLTSVVIPDGVTRLEEWAFAICENLTSVTIPASVTYIGYVAFYYCPNLSTIYYGGTQEQWEAIVKEDGWDNGTGAYTIVFATNCPGTNNHTVDNCAYTVVKVTEPTCGDVGYTTYKCNVCGQIFVDSIVPATGEHTYGEWTVTIEPTTEAAGEETRTCSVCGAQETRTINRLVSETDPQIYLESVKGQAGDTVIVNVYIKNNPGVMYLNLTLEYDSAVMTLVSVTNGVLLDTMTAATNIVWDTSAACTEDGLLCTLVFQLSEDAEEGQYVVNATVNEAYDANYDDVNLAVLSAVVEVCNVIYGDANGDGKVNGKDLMLLRKYMANYNFSTGVSTVEVEAGADANGDGNINGKDLMLLRKYMANYDFTTGESTIVLGPTG